MERKNSCNISAVCDISWKSDNMAWECDLNGEGESPNFENRNGWYECKTT